MMQHDEHPTRGIDTRELCLPGRQARGVPAADIRVGKGADGLWYAAYGYFYGNGGCASPITHCPGFATEREAIEDRASIIGEACAKIASNTTHNFTDGDRTWARRIVEWCNQQLAPTQGAFDL